MLGSARRLLTTVRVAFVLGSSCLALLYRHKMREGNLAGHEGGGSRGAQEERGEGPNGEFGERHC